LLLLTSRNLITDISNAVMQYSNCDSWYQQYQL